VIFENCNVFLIWWVR